MFNTKGKRIEGERYQVLDCDSIVVEANFITLFSSLLPVGIPDGAIPSALGEC
jgi:hypothetical protein